MRSLSYSAPVASTGLTLERMPRRKRLSPPREEEALDALRTALAGGGRKLVTAQLQTIDPSPAGDLLGFDVSTRGAGVDTEQQRIYLEPAAADGPPAGVVRAMQGERGWDVWAYPNDPQLPALAAAAHPTAARVLLDRMDLYVDGEPRVESLSYRPHRRAVLRVTTRLWTIFLKVVPPAATEAIAERHTRWAAAGIDVPPVLAWSPAGLIALGALPGRALAEDLAEVAADPTFSDRLAELRLAIGRIDEPRPARRSFAARADWYRRRLGRRYPEHADELASLTSRISHLYESSQPRTEAIHGDLHLGQLFQDADGRLSVLDLDTGGTGDPADDDAAMWAHLVATALRAPHDPTQAAAEHDGDDRAAAALQLAQLLAPSRHPDAARRARAAAISAAHLLGHALTGAIPVEIALRIADRVLSDPDESPLISSYTSSHLTPKH